MARQGWSAARRGKKQGGAGVVRRGMAWRGRARRDVAWQGWLGWSGRGGARWGKARQGRRGVAWGDVARLGMARQGEARHGNENWRHTKFPVLLLR